ncbi:hypothetical protein METBIDRAFT_42198, partial [Metschnikowia bicuspidata var. bicuspidata NRRL YB-4993]
ISSNMFRQIASRTIAPLSARVSPNARYLSYSRVNLSVVDTAKDILHKANKKTGEVLANTIDTTEKVTPSGEQVKDAATNAASAANQKAGDVLADGIEKAEDISHKAKQTATDANLGEKAKDAAQSAQQFSHKAKETTIDMKDHANAKKKVLENARGYENLQDKGSKVETEQNRPDDAV